MRFANWKRGIEELERVFYKFLFHINLLNKRNNDVNTRVRIRFEGKYNESKYKCVSKKGIHYNTDV